MEKGTNYSVECALNYIKATKRQEIEQYIADCLNRDFVVSSSNELLEEKAAEFIDKLNPSEQSTIRSYTGFQFRNINAILRDNWSYEVNGQLTPKLREEYYNLAEEIRQILYKAVPISQNIKCYRGVSLSAFSSYNIFTMKDLYFLQGKYLYEPGFTSTSIDKEKSFFYTNPYTLTGKPNILIEYLIPEESDDGVLLSTSNISFSPNQSEFIINSSSLFKVLDVQIDETKVVAYLKAILVPEKIWNYQDYLQERTTIIRH